MHRGNSIMAQMVRWLALGLITSRQFHIRNLLYFTVPTNFQHKYQLRGRNLGGGARHMLPPRNDAYGDGPTSSLVTLLGVKAIEPIYKFTPIINKKITSQCLDELASENTFLTDRCLNAFCVS